MPLYDWQCTSCGRWFEERRPEEVNQITCMFCRGVAEKRFTKLTTAYKDKDRRWGRSLYFSHDAETEKKRRKEGKKR